MGGMGGGMSSRLQFGGGGGGFNRKQYSNESYGAAQAAGGSRGSPNEKGPGGPAAQLGGGAGITQALPGRPFLPNPEFGMAQPMKSSPQLMSMMGGNPQLMQMQGGGYPKHSMPSSTFGTRSQGWAPPGMGGGSMAGHFGGGFQAPGNFAGMMQRGGYALANRNPQPQPAQQQRSGYALANRGMPQMMGGFGGRGMNQMLAQMLMRGGFR
jgi:hypothetical protein